MNDDLIKRSDAIQQMALMLEDISEDLSEQIIQRFGYESAEELATEAMSIIPSTDRPQGEWEEKTAFHNEDDNPIIEEWQSAKCSVCGKYHTTPYLYYFDDFNYCPNCGARMKGDTNGRL